MKCKTCNHPQRRAIDLALLAENHTLEALGRAFGLSISSLFRHRKHLVARLIRTRQRLRNAQTQGSLLRLSGFLDRVQQGVDTAAADGNVIPVFRGAHVGSRIIHQMNKMEVPLELETVYRLITSPQWASGGSLLPADPQTLAGLQQSVRDDAFFPCPELHLEPALVPADDDAGEVEENDAIAAAAPDFPAAVAARRREDDPPALAAPDRHEDLVAPNHTEAPAALAVPELEADPAGLAAATPDLAAALEQTLLAQPELAGPLTDLLHHLSLLPENDPATTPKSKREKSAKLARKIAPRAKNNKQYQKDSTSEKKAPKYRHIGRESTRKGGEAQAPPTFCCGPPPSAYHQPTQPC